MTYKQTEFPSSSTFQYQNPRERGMFMGLRTAFQVDLHVLECDAEGCDDMRAKARNG